MKEGKGGRRCGIGRRERCGGLATILRAGLRGSGGGGALAGKHLEGGGRRFLKIYDLERMQGDKIEWGKILTKRGLEDSGVAVRSE